ncbi:MAG: antitoxin Xre/MbcA/ParS toxin-binding domain-containing protein [Bacteroidota bacterium]|jgi:putative toxin-antitoxin system antitoxin component (TIGR02293 family)
MSLGKVSIEQKLDKEIAHLLSQSLKADLPAVVNSPKRKPTSYEEFLTDKMLIVVVIRLGIPYSLFNLIQHYTPFTENDWASLLDLSTKSLQRYKQASKSFGPLQSEKIIEMAEVTKAGLDVFDNLESFRIWLNTPNYALGSLPPMELLKDSYGKEMVMGELIRIDNGIFV